MSHNYFKVYRNGEEAISFDNNYEPSTTTIEQAEWLHAQSDRFPEGQVDDTNAGKWMIFLSPDQINAAWNKLLTAVKNARLWQVKVSTKNPSYPSHVLIIYVPNIDDIKEVIHVYDTLKNIGLVKDTDNIKFKTDKQTLSGNSSTAFTYQASDLLPLREIEKNKLYLSWKYSDRLDARAVIYGTLFAETRAILQGQRKLFANTRAWWNNAGYLFADSRAILTGRKPLFANTRAALGKLTQKDLVQIEKKANKHLR